MSKRETSLFQSGYKFVSINPANGDKYSFNTTVMFWQEANSRVADGRVEIVCFRNDVEMVIIQSYHLEPMNHFSLFALAQNYLDLCANWIVESPLEHKITTAQQCFARGKGPVIKISGKMVKSLDLEIVEVAE